MTNQQDDHWEMPRKRQYQCYIVSLMSFFHAVDYPPDQTFTRAELLELTPHTIKYWMADKAFGDPDYDVERGDRPVYARSNTLAMMKKAVSYFMPNKGQGWIVNPDGTGFGNPTMSNPVNGLLNEVKKFEVRNEGAGSQTKRALRQAEFRKTLELLKREDDSAHKLLYPCIAVVQYNIIGRVDDCCELLMTDPRGHPQFDFALKTKVRWSKNVMEERNCPDQILLAASDSDFCVHLHLATYMEYALELNNGQHWLFTDTDHGTPNAVENLIDKYRGRLKIVAWSKDEFKELEDEDDREEGRSH